MSRTTAAKSITDDRSTSPSRRTPSRQTPCALGAPRLSAPFPYFGGKSRIAHLVWQTLGDPKVYIEPFFGSGAVLLARPPSEHTRELINDKDAFIANFWRATKRNPRAVARWADWPSNEVDLQARHRWLCAADRKRRFVARMRRDPDYSSPKIAGWWVWGISQWIGGGFCSGEWHGLDHPQSLGDGMRSSKRPNISPMGVFANRRFDDLPSEFDRLSKRLRRAIVCCGDWRRLTTNAFFCKSSSVGVFLDPPYDHQVGRTTNIYAEELVSTADVRAFCIERGTDPRVRIVLAGYEGEYRLPGWKVVPWMAGSGMAKSVRGIANRERERLWLSPHCHVTADVRRHVRDWRRRSDAADTRPTDDKHRPDRRPSNRATTARPVRKRGPRAENVRTSTSARADMPKPPRSRK